MTENPERKHKAKVYTKTGDKGTSSLYNMKRLSKDDDHFHALGDTDELNGQLGMAREFCLQAGHVELEGYISEIQSRLFDVGACVATPRLTSSAAQLERTAFHAESITDLENWMDAMDEKLPPLKHFILPSGGFTSSCLHVARSICRRAERRIVPLVQEGDCDEVVMRYMNRLSDFLFVAARYVAMQEGKEEVKWIAPRSRLAAKAETAAATSESDLSEAASPPESSS